MNKKKSIVFIIIFTIVIVLGAVFSLVDLNKGQLGNKDYKAFPKSIKLGLDLKGGVYAVYDAKKEDLSNDEFKQRLDGTVKNFQELLFSKGYPEANVSLNGSQIRVEVPDVANPEDVFALIGRPAEVVFKTKNDDNFNPKSKEVVLTGKEVKKASVGRDQDGKFMISLEFNDKGTNAFAEATKELQPKQGIIYIFVNRNLLTSPRVQAVIPDGKAQITGDYTYESANELALRIQSGSLPLKLELSESNTISPTLGANALKHGLLAGGIGLLLIFILLIAMYGLGGVAATLSLIYYTITYLFFMSIFPWVQLTLPGIAGILLSIGMAVDANIIIFERAKEEYRESGGVKLVSTCFENGFKKSLSAIVDGNITTIIGAIVLIIFAVASIKGFAITLLIGIVLSLFSSLVVTRLLVYSLISFGVESPKTYNLKLDGEKLFGRKKVAEVDSHEKV